MEWYVMGSLLIVGLLVLCAIGIPISFALLLTGLIPFFVLRGFTTSVDLIGYQAWQTWYSYTFIAIPLFMLMSEVISFTGVGKDLFDAAESWVGFVPGGLAVSSIVACAVFGAVSSSSMIGALTIGGIAIPEMLRRGYNKSLATGCVAAGGTLNVLIPPSIIMIFYGIVTEQPIGTLFIAGIIPGIILMFFFAGYVVIRAKLNPTLASAMPTASLGERMRLLPKVLPIIALAFVVMASLYSGAATPSEAAGIGAFGSILIAIGYRKLNRTNSYEALKKTATLMGFLGILIVGANILGWVLGYYRIPQQFAEVVASLPVDRWVIFGIIVMMYFFLGMFLETISMTFITLPIIFPLVHSLGFNPIWFGVIYTILCEMCSITPPVGLNLYVVQSVVKNEVTITEVIQGTYPFVGFLFLLILVVCVFPQLALWLPGKM